jgi:hypothetical protein
LNSKAKEFLTLSNLNDGEKVTFDLTDNDDEGWILENGDNRTVRIKADIISGVEENFDIKFDEVKSDVIATGLTYGFGVGLTETNITTIASEADRKIAIQGGDITFAISSTSRDVAPDTDSVEFGILTISNFGEAIEIKDGLTLILDVDTSDIGAGVDRYRFQYHYRRTTRKC